MIATTVEQSKHFIKLDVPIESADMHYVRKIRDFRGNLVDGKFSYPKYGNTQSEHANYLVQNFTEYELLSAWSLAALLDLMPHRLDDGSELLIEKWEDGYLVTYGAGCHFFGNNNIEAAYKMVVWLAENGYLRMEEQQ